MAKAKKNVKQLDETGKRKSDRRKAKTGAAANANKPAVERRKVKRRRQIDPTTCEREYSDLEIEFMHAMDEYKRASGRMFPTCSEILEVLIDLGYRKTAEAQPIFAQGSASEVESTEKDLEYSDEAL